MGKNIIILILTILMFGQIEAKPDKKGKVYTSKPGKPRPQKYYVKVQPARPTVVVIRPSAPAPNFVWTDGDWVWSPQQQQYIYEDGHWIEPVQTAVWVPGHWRNTRYGWFWVKGHWK